MVKIFYQLDVSTFKYKSHFYHFSRLAGRLASFSIVTEDVAPVVLRHALSNNSTPKIANTLKRRSMLAEVGFASSRA